MARAKKTETATAVNAETKEVKIPEQNREELEQLKETNAQLQTQLAEMMKQIEELKNQKPQVITFSGETEKVQFLWEAPVADDNVVDFGMNGMYGRIVGKTGAFSVPKSEMSRVMTSDTRMFLDMRWLIIVSGLTDEEREAYGVDYKENEVLDRQMFRKMVDMGDRIVEVYPQLCDHHKDIVAKTFYETWLKDPVRVDKEVVKKLYKMDKKEAFKRIIKGMNAAELEDEE